VGHAREGLPIAADEGRGSLEPLTAHEDRAEGVVTEPAGVVGAADGRLHHVGRVLQHQVRDRGAVPRLDGRQVRDPEGEHVRLERAALREPPLALGRLDERHPVQQAGERVGPLGVAQALAQPPQVGAPFHALPLVCE
jgi:hypothetical protein